MWFIGLKEVLQSSSKLAALALLHHELLLSYGAFTLLGEFFFNYFNKLNY